MSRDKYFFDGLFGFLFFVKKVQNKVSACFYDSLNNCGNLSSNPLQGAGSRFSIAGCDS
jgi:hypothetical protein